MPSGCIAAAYTVHCYGVGRFHYRVNMTVFTCLNTLKNTHLSALIDKIIVSLFYSGYAFEIIIGTVLRTRGKSLQKCRRRRRRSSSSGGRGGGTSSSSKELVVSSTSSSRWWY